MILQEERTAVKYTGNQSQVGRFFDSYHHKPDRT